MKKSLLTWVILFVLVGCSQTLSPTPVIDTPHFTSTSQPGEIVTKTPSPQLPSPTSTPDKIKELLATQAAQSKSVTAVPRPTPITMPADSLRVTSPDGKIVVDFGLIEGVPYYRVTCAGLDVILPSKLGFTFLTDAPLNSGLSILDWEQGNFDETWTQPWGEVKEIRDHHNELRIWLQEESPEPRELVIVFRVFNDGIGFRYELPEQPHLSEFKIMDEQTEFALSDDHTAWWIPAYQDNRYEYLYHNTPINVLSRPAIKAVHTPLTIETTEGLYLSIHEAALTDYASMTLKADENLVLHCDLVPWADGVKVQGSTPLKTPWRTIRIAENPGDLITSYLILNLNEPNALEDISWIKPGKYVGIWWGMHLGTWTWGRGPRHGATTENAQAYLDFAAQHGFAGVLVEGWNYGWDGNWVVSDSFDFTTPYPDFDLEGLAAYAAERGVKIIGHHETAAGIDNYERQMEDGFALNQSLGIDTVKTGYVGIRVTYLDENDKLQWQWHHGQFMVEHYRKVVETAAKYGIMIDAHEPIKDTGIRRTYPNMMTREGARGQEYNAWGEDGGNPPDHVTILPFTRLLSGPMDYTPGVLALTYPEYRPENRVNHTLAKELALYVVIYSPMQMAADLIENYANNPAFQFVQDVPVDWHETQVLHAQIGDYITIVRRERDGDEWFLGSITDEEARTLQTKLGFLDPNMTYVAEIYTDGEDADWDENPYAIEISRVLVDSDTELILELAHGGGQAIRFYPASEDEIGTMPTYQP
jgi:alpha-glucosidase